MNIGKYWGGQRQTSRMWVRWYPPTKRWWKLKRSAPCHWKEVRIQIWRWWCWRSCLNSLIQAEMMNHDSQADDYKTSALWEATHIYFYFFLCFFGFVLFIFFKENARWMFTQTNLSKFNFDGISRWIRHVIPGEYQFLLSYFLSTLIFALMWDSVDTVYS